MSKLLIPDLDDATLGRLQQRAAEHGRSIESEAKAILMRALPATEASIREGPLDVCMRLNELRALTNGWLEGAGKAPPASGLDWLADAFRTHYAEELPSPRLYPTPQGGIQAEWSFGAVDLSLEIDLEHHRGRWHRLDMESAAEETRELDLDQGPSWQWLSEEIARNGRGAA